MIGYIVSALIWLFVAVSNTACMETVAECTQSKKSEKH